MEYMTDFKSLSFAKRQHLSSTIMSKNPGAVPFVVDRSDLSAPTLKHNKFLVPRDLTMAQFYVQIRKGMVILEHQAMFYFVGKAMPTSTEMIGAFYEKHKSDDGFLYMVYTLENTFGSGAP